MNKTIVENENDIFDCFFDTDMEISDLPSDNYSYIDDLDADPDFIPNLLSVSNAFSSIPLVISVSGSDIELKDELPIPVLPMKRKLTTKCKKSVNDIKISQHLSHNITHTDLFYYYI